MTYIYIFPLQEQSLIFVNMRAIQVLPYTTEIDKNKAKVVEHDPQFNARSKFYYKSNSETE